MDDGPELDGAGQLELLTITGLWRFPRYLYRFMDKALGSPLNLRLVGWSLLVVPPVWLLLGQLPVGWRGPGAAAHVFLPGTVVWLVLTKVASGAKPWEVVWAWVRMVWWARRRARRTPVGVRLHSRSRA